MENTMGANELRGALEVKLSRYFGVSLKDATKSQIYKAMAILLRDILITKRSDLKDKINEQKAKRIYYMSIEFLLGRSLKNNISNLGLAKSFFDFLPLFLIKFKKSRNFALHFLPDDV